MTPVLLLWILAVSVSSGVCYDPDIDLTTPQIIRRHGYSVESHTVLTDDGYLLTLHRITGSPNRRPHTPASRQPTVSYPTAVSANKTTTASYTTPLEDSANTSYSQISLPPQPSTATAQATTTTTTTPTQSTPQTTTQQTIIQTTSTQTTTPQTTATITTTPQTTTQTTVAIPPQTTSTQTTTQTTTPQTTTATITTTCSPIFVQHGLLGSSADWIMSGPGKALAYLLADEGYDVWLGNARGNVYSRAHVTLSTSDSKFWNFSWHEMGYYDLPAAIDYMTNVTGSSSVMYIGHSMGTTMFYVMASSRPEYNAKIRAMFSLAPVAYMRDIKSPIRLIARYAHDIEFILHILGQHEFLPRSKFLGLLAKYGCLLVSIQKKICENLLFLLTGFDAAEFDKSLLPLILRHTPAGTSTKAILHYAHEVRSGKFRQYDYGTSENWKIYNQSSPPEYNLSLITAPIELHYAKNDWLANTKDVEEFYRKLKSGIGKYLVKFPQFNHVDFLWGKDAKTLVYDVVIDRVKQYSPPPTKISIGKDDPVKQYSPPPTKISIGKDDSVNQFSPPPTEIPIGKYRELAKVTSKWYRYIKRKYSLKEHPQETGKKFRGIQKTIFVTKKKQEENML